MGTPEGLIFEFMVVCDSAYVYVYFPHTYLVAIYSPPSEKSTTTPKYSAPGIRCVGGVADG